METRHDYADCHRSGFFNPDGNCVCFPSLIEFETWMEAWWRLLVTDSLDKVDGRRDASNVGWIGDGTAGNVVVA